jgi:Mrp family chromosome partitioning ATPase/capsular polysaccharide biosynthesis protein
VAAPRLRRPASAREPLRSEAMTNLFAKFRRRWPVVVVSTVVFTAVGLATLPTAHSTAKGSQDYLAHVTIAQAAAGVGKAAGTNSSSSSGSSTGKSSSKSSGSTTTNPVTDQAANAGVSKQNAAYLALANTPDVAAAAEQILGPSYSPKKVAKEINFSVNQSGEIVVRAKDKSAAKSAAEAKAFATALINAATAAQKKTQAQISARLTQELGSLASRIHSLEEQQRTPGSTTTTSVAKSPKKTKTPSTTVAPAAGQSTGDPVRTAEIDASLQDYSNLYRALLDNQQRDTSKAPLQIIQVKAPALQTPSGSKPIRKRYWAAGGFGLGLLLGLIAVTALALLDRSVTDETKAESLFGLPVLAYVPADTRSRRDRRPVVVGLPVSQCAEAYRRLTSSLEQLPTHAVDPVAAVVRPALDGRDEGTGSRRADGSRQILGLVGSGRRSGCTTVLANLAAALVERDFEPLAVDANLRRPALHDVLGVDPVPGVLDGMTPGDSKVSTLVPRVRVIPAGSPSANPPRDLHRIASALPGWRRSAGVILVDIADLASTNDAAALAGELDALVVVCARPTATPRRIQRILRDLGRSGAPVLGVALVEVHTGFLRRIAGGRPPSRTRSRPAKAAVAKSDRRKRGRRNGKDAIPDVVTTGPTSPNDSRGNGAHALSGGVDDAGVTPG